MGHTLLEQIFFQLQSISISLRILHYSTDRKSTHETAGQFYQEFDRLADTYFETLMGALEEHLQVTESPVLVLWKASPLDPNAGITELRRLILEKLLLLPAPTPGVENALQELMQLFDHESYFLSLK